MPFKDGTRFAWSFFLGSSTAFDSLLHHFDDVFLGGYASVRIIAEHLVDDVDHHLLEFFEELARIVAAAFDFTQLFFPYTGQLG